MLSADTIVHLAQTLIVGLLIAGRWLQAREGGERVTTAQVVALEARITGEHNERKRLVEQVNRDLGTLRIEQGRHDERLKALERQA